MRPSQPQSRSRTVRAPHRISGGSCLRRGAVALLLAAVLPGCDDGTGPAIEQADFAAPDRHLFAAPELSTPAEGETLIAAQPVFAWQLDRCRERAVIEICSDRACTGVLQRLESETCSGTGPAPELQPGTYYWRAALLRGKKLASAWSEVRSFILAAPPVAVTADLYGVWSVSASEVYAVGTGGTLLRYNGTSWLTETSPTTKDLRAVFATSAGQAFAVGAGGTILRRSGNSWSSLASPVSVDLTGVWGSSASDVWATGGAVVLHWNGTSWTVAHDRVVGMLRAVSGTSSSDVWVGGSGNEPDGDRASVLLHWDGASWTESYICNPEGNRFASGGWLASISDLWAVPGGTAWATGACQSGASFIAFGFLAQKPSGGTWGETPGFGFGQPLGDRRPLFTVWSSGANNVWAASSSVTVFGGMTPPTMMHFDGMTWTPSPQDITAGVQDLGGTSASDVWAVGKAGKRLHFDGTTWTAVP